MQKLEFWQTCKCFHKLDSFSILSGDNVFTLHNKMSATPNAPMTKV